MLHSPVSEWLYRISITSIRASWMVDKHDANGPLGVLFASFNYHSTDIVVAATTEYIATVGTTQERG